MKIYFLNYLKMKNLKTYQANIMIYIWKMSLKNAQEKMLQDTEKCVNL